MHHEPYLNNPPALCILRLPFSYGLEARETQPLDQGPADAAHRSALLRLDRLLPRRRLCFAQR